MKYLQFKMEGVDDQGIFTGHASVFNVVDLDGDVVEPGAFAETLATGAASAGVLIFGQHEDRKEPLGRTLELREDSIGLYVKGQISDTTAGRDYRQLIRDGVLDQMSIGYIALEYYIDEQQVRHLTKLDLLEISIVNYPANTEARIESYKGGKKPMEPKDTKSKETKEQTTETGQGRRREGCQGGQERRPAGRCTAQVCGDLPECGGRAQGGEVHPARWHRLGPVSEVHDAGQ